MDARTMVEATRASLHSGRSPRVKGGRASAELDALAAARRYGRRAAALPQLGDRVWDDMALVLRTGCAAYNREVYPAVGRHDWRGGWSGVKDGWMHSHSLSSKEQGR